MTYSAGSLNEQDSGSGKVMERIFLGSGKLEYKKSRLKSLCGGLKVPESVIINQ